MLRLGPSQKVPCRTFVAAMSSCGRGTLLQLSVPHILLTRFLGVALLLLLLIVGDDGDT